MPLLILFFISIMSTGAFAQNNHYDFTQVKKIKTMGTYKIRATDIRAIVFDASEGNIIDNNIFDKGDTSSFNIDKLYRCKFDSSEAYFYFRIYWEDFDVTESRLFVHWEPSAPIMRKTQAVIEMVEAPFIQKGKVRVCTIGDSQTWLFNGEDYRYYWSVLNDNLSFVGNRTDNWGFGHEGAGGDSSLDVIERMGGFKKADIYVLLIGTNDQRKVKLTSAGTVENIGKIVDHLHGINKKARVYVLTIPPCDQDIRKEHDQDPRDKHNQETNALLKEKFNGNQKRTYVLDLERVFREKENWQKGLFIDGLHPNDEGYQLMTGFLNENIK